MDTDTASKPLPNRPDAKLPPLSKGSRVQKRPLPRRTPLSLSRVDIDGYISPSFCKPGGSIRTPTCVYVGSKTPFMAVVKRVRKALESGGGAQPRSTRGLPLTARVAALSTSSRGAPGRSNNNSEGGQDGSNESSEGEVIVLGTGRAIEKTLNVAAWFQRQSDCRISLRTRSVAAVDDVVLGNAKSADGDWDADADPDDADAEQEGDDEAEDHSRVRMVSCLEVAVRLR
ncbi:hypothetical protein CONLIGDRAFT_308768 [Coniochaeta ligniaria NRRL 30616]|uniref:Uncharacterized protein n=1 Tax=Coniochaeta ligniaria NRRL 30616 TaxID=1408157 RepID=A0A1J7IVS7_9PEZI|nr:hypothetical protein CONLIGDRAFT_308768 [Coniochaeta ligniaria NRRL 30616]